ncbi:MAG TPA: VOC family protein [Gemmatimonadaceae bacterium]|nr:VOC family protein [Gemmatimonadaceae bacterium]
MRFCGFATALSAALTACAVTQPALAPQPLIGSGRGVDHVTLLTQDVAAAAKRFADDFGFTVGPTRKLSFGFESAVIYFADLTYIELYAIHDRKVVGESTEAFALEAPEGLTWVTLHVDSARRAAEFLRQLGKPVFGPDSIPESEENWRFKLTGPQQAFLPGGRIYFIEYNEAVRARFRTENRAMVQSREIHPNTAQGLRSIWITVADLTAAAAIYTSAGMATGPEFELAALSTQAREIRMRGGTILLALQSAGSPSRNAAFTGISIKVGSIDAIRTRVLKRRGLNLEPYAGRYGRSVRIPASLGYGTVIEFFQ